MDVHSFCPLRATTLVWQRRPSSWVLTVICKATYLLKPGESPLAPEQEDISEADDHWNDDLDRSVRSPCDLAPVKPRADISLVGHAFVPARAQTRRLMARLIVGDVDKSIEITCDRVISSDGNIQEGARFHRMAIGYERAAGGAGTTNPVGVRLEARDMYGRRSLPNVQRPDVHINSIDGVIEPVGFGPIGARWPSRMKLVGNDPNKLPQLRTPMLPDGFDLTYYNHAPEDQQVATLRENERIVLENLHPEHPRLVTSLPGLRPAVFIQHGRLHGHRVHLRPDTLWIDTDRAIATVTFRGQVPLTRPDEKGTVLVALQEGATALAFADVERLASSVAKPAAKPAAQEHTVVGFEVPGSAPVAAVPFTNTGSAFSANANPSPNTTQPSAVDPWSEATVTIAKTSASGAAPGAHAPAWLASSAAAPSSTQTPQAIAPQQAAPAALRPQVPAPPPSYPRPAAFAAPAAPASQSGPAVMPPRPMPSAAPTWTAPTTGETFGMKAAAAAATAAAAVAVDAQSGAVAASNAAAGPAPAAAPWDVARRDRKAAPDSDARIEPEEPQKELIQLMWFDPKISSRLRRVPRWKPVLDELEDAPPDRMLDDTGHDPGEVDDMREVFEIVAHGERTDARSVDEALQQAVRDDGKFLPPLALVAGDLEVCFDELAQLKAALALSSPITAPTDESLKSAIAAARELLAADPDLPPTVAEAATKRIHEAFARDKKLLPPDHLDAQMDRLLLSSRAMQKRLVFGEQFVRTHLHMAGAEHAMIVYLPMDAAKKLPLYKRFRARLIVEIHPAQDASETRPQALRTFTLARTTPVAKKV